MIVRLATSTPSVIRHIVYQGTLTASQLRGFYHDVNRLTPYHDSTRLDSTRKGNQPLLAVPPAPGVPIPWVS